MSTPFAVTTDTVALAVKRERRKIRLEINMIDIKKVEKVGKERIKYKNEKGEYAYIELGASANTWAYRHPESAREDGLRCVGDSYCDGKIAYIEFYNIGHVKIGVQPSPIVKIFGKGLSAKQTDDFNSFKKELEQNGYTTYDIS